MKALTLHQPWASLAAHGIKTIETRSWPVPEGLVGQRIAIHAAKKAPVAGFEVGNWNVEWWADIEHFGVRHRSETPAFTLPLGAVVGSAVPADCVPIVRCVEGASIEHVCNTVDGLLHHRPLSWFPNGEDWTERVIDDQLPFGDFSPGRWAWLLTDAAPTNTRCPWCWADKIDEYGVSRVLAGAADIGGGTLSSWETCPACNGQGHCDPIDATGKQGVWEWTP